MRNPRTLCLVGTIALIAIAAPISHGATITVNIFSFGFSTGEPGGPPWGEPTINIGDTIHWIVRDGFHTTISCSGQLESWDSGLIGTGRTFDHTFTNAGDFGYYCLPHGFDMGNGTGGGMASVVHVVPGPSSLMCLAPGLLLVRRRRRD